MRRVVDFEGLSALGSALGREPLAKIGLQFSRARISGLYLLLEPRDLWFGLYWNRWGGPRARFVDLYFGVPFVVLKLTVLVKKERR